MAGILIPQNIQCFFESGLLNLAMSSKVAASWAVVDEVMLCQKALGPSIVAGGEVYLS